MPDERRHPFIVLGQRQITDLLQPVFRGAVVTAFEPLPGGFANTLYRVFVHGRTGPVVLRIYTHDPLACRKEVALAQRLVGKVPMAEVLYADTSCQRIKYPYSVLSWVDGVLIDFVLRHGDRGDVRQAGEAAGATLAAISSVPFDQRGLLGPDLEIAQPLGEPAVACKQFIARCLAQGAAINALGAELAAELWLFVMSNVALLDDAPGGAWLTHGDYKPTNLLVYRDGSLWQMSGVLDWEFSFAFTPLFDLGQILRHDLTLPPPFESAVTSGFVAHGGVLPPHWKAMVKMLDFMNLCDFAAAPEPRPALMAEIKLLLRSTMDRWPELLAAK